jgi:hypothetical protein
VWPKPVHAGMTGMEGGGGGGDLILLRSSCGLCHTSPFYLSQTHLSSLALGVVSAPPEYFIRSRLFPGVPYQAIINRTNHCIYIPYQAPGGFSVPGWPFFVPGGWSRPQSTKRQLISKKSEAGQAHWVLGVTQRGLLCIRRKYYCRTSNQPGHAGLFGPKTSTSREKIRPPGHPGPRQG